MEEEKEEEKEEGRWVEETTREQRVERRMRLKSDNKLARQEGNKIKITHLLFIDDNKQFSKPKNHREEVLNTERAFRDVGLMYTGKKSAFVRVVNGKLEEGEKITLSTGQEIASLKENEYYKYLGIYENKVIEVVETWKINVVKYLQR